MIKHIAAAVAGTALAVTFGASAAHAHEPTPNSGRVAGVPSVVYPDGLNTLNTVSPLPNALPL
ncbi:hypothetical protein [Embleya scabrispora]|uniref:hypothetical protein n=1 Tax=Embleya scabrispora TaxID=159449 RepID=UPI000370C07D|nr:hypothetical protein [Embleya scabrispora]MYS87353.1 hypothetical protein [Streptomyces sp. SID5474]